MVCVLILLDLYHFIYSLPYTITHLYHSMSFAAWGLQPLVSHTTLHEMYSTARVEQELIAILKHDGNKGSLYWGKRYVYS